MPTPRPRPWRRAHWRAARWHMPLSVALAVLLAVGVFAGAEWTYQRALDSLVNLGGRDTARNALQTVMRRLLDIESAQRGYLLTGRAAYLQPYQAARTDLGNAIGRLHEHYRSDPELARLVDTLEEKSLQKVSEAAETISLYDAGSHAAWQGLVLTDIGREKMDAVRRVADVLLATEERRIAGERAAIYRTLEMGRLGVHGLALLSLLAYIFFLRNNVALQASQVAHAAQLRAERDAFEQQVRQRTEELALLNLGLQEMREGERGGLARALHDDLGALLTTAKLDLTRLRHALSAPSADVSARLQHLSATLDQGIETKRRLMEGLMPSALQNLGLHAALEQRADELHQRTGVAVELDLQPLELDASTRQALFAVAQGALSNVERHAGAGRVVLRLSGEDGAVALSVADNGRGFAERGGSTSALGLRNLRHRIESLGGTFTVHSAPGDGTHVEVRLPGRARPTEPTALPEDPPA